MSKRAWIHLINPFDVNTSGSQPKMLSLTSDTDSKLNNESADADILAIFNEYHPVHVAYRDMFQNYEMVSGERKGKTLNLETLMSEGLSLELRKWEAAVRTVYPEDSPEEVEIFPNKRQPFQTGSYELRIAAVGALAQKLQGDPAFAALALQVASYHNVLLSARDTQQQKEGAIGNLSDLLESQRIINAKALYGIVLGQLMKKFRNDPSQIERFFDMTILRETGGDEDTTPEDTLIVEGKITNSETGVPIVNATVLLNAPDGSNQFTVVTDAEGLYKHTITTLPAGESGTVTLITNVPGFQNFTQTMNVTVGNTYTVDMALLPV